MGPIKRELTEDEMIIFIKLQEQENVDELFEQIILAGGWVLKVIEKRFFAHKIGVDKKVIIFVLAISDGVVGRCVKYVDDIVCCAEKNNYTEIDWVRFTAKIYPYKIPIF
jgi:hypothetical protein